MGLFGFVNQFMRLCSDFSMKASQRSTLEASIKLLKYNRLKKYLLTFQFDVNLRGSPWLTSRNFGQFLTPFPLSRFLLLRTKYCRLKFYDLSLLRPWRHLKTNNLKKLIEPCASTIDIVHFEHHVLLLLEKIWNRSFCCEFWILKFDQDNT